MRGIAVAATLVCSATMLSGCGGNGATSHETLFGRATASGRHASALADGRTGPFTKLSVHVVAAPDQRVRGSWSVACRLGDGSMVGRDGDTFTGRTPLTIQMRTVTTPIPTTCTAVGGATLAGSGRVTVQLFGA